MFPPIHNATIKETINPIIGNPNTPTNAIENIHSSDTKIGIQIVNPITKPIGASIKYDVIILFFNLVSII